MGDLKMVLTVLYWVFLVLGAIFGFFGTWPGPSGEPRSYAPFGFNVFLIILFVLIGLKAFPFQ